jgi:hypothetical protein
MKKFLLLLSFLSLMQYVQAQYKFNYTYQHKEGNFASPETYFADMNDTGVIVGYYLNPTGGRTALIFWPSGKTQAYNHPGYDYCEFTGINNDSVIVGKAYLGGSTLNAIALKGIIDVKADTLKSVTSFTYGVASDDFRDPRKINNNQRVVGHLRKSNIYNGVQHRWGHYEDLLPPNTSFAYLYNVGANYSTTFALGITDNNVTVGYYLNPLAVSEHIPFVNTAGTSAGITSLPHANAAATLKGTRLIDINNNGEVAIRWRNNAGVWQGGVGQLNSSFNSITYNYINFPFQGSLGSEVLGINNKGDIVGYFMEPGITKAFFAKKQMKVPGFSYIFDYFTTPFENSGSKFTYNSTTALDYVNNDPYKNNGTSFVNTYISPSYGVKFNTPTEGIKFLNGHRYPSWLAYNYAQSGDSVYKTINGTPYARLSEVQKYLSLSDSTFKGYCYGHSGYAAQNFADSSIIYDRFPNTVNEDTLFNLSASYFSTNPTHYQPFKEALGAGYLFQYGKNQLKLAAKIQNYFIGKTCNATSPTTADYDSIKYLMDKLYLRMQHKEKDINLLAIYYKTAVAGAGFKGGGHSVLPIEVRRSTSFSNVIDTVTVCNPNVPGENYYYVIDYNNLTTTSYDLSFNQDDLTSTGLNKVGVVMPDISVSENMINDEALFKQGKTKSGCKVFTNYLCDFLITNTANINDTLKRINGLYESNFNNLIPITTKEKDAGDPKFADSDNTLSLKNEITSCAGNNLYQYIHPEGHIMYYKHNATTGDKEAVYTDANYLKVENMDNKNKYIGMQHITEFTTEESSINIDSFKLLANDSVVFTAVDQYHYHVKNSPTTPSNYNLSIRHLGDTTVFTKDIKNIPISKNTTHIIELFPAAPINKVIIKVDSLNDGTIDDTLDIGLGPNNIQNFDVYKNISISPTIVTNNLGIHNLPSNNAYKANILSIDGKCIKTVSLYNKEVIEVSDLPSGLYFVVIANQNNIVYRQKFIKQ